MSDLTIDIKSVNEITPGLTSFIKKAYDREFGDDTMVYASPEWYLLGYLRGEPITQAGVLQRTISIEQKSLLIAGVSFLVTEPDSRGQGYGTTMMKEAMAFVKNTLRLPFGLLTCKPRLESLYSGMGWRTIQEPNTFVQPTGNRSCGGIIMVNECGGKTWPEGEIDFRGLPW